MQEQSLQIISLGTIGVLTAIFIFLVLELFKIKNPLKQYLIKKQMHILAILSTTGVFGSILLSVYFKIAPCELCWYQRVFLFSIPIIAWISIYKNDRQARLYIFVLSCIGAVIALYHSLIQSNIFKADSVFCNPVSSGVDCSVAFFTYYGFVTVPVMSFAVFMLLLISSYGYKKIQN